MHGSIVFSLSNMGQCHFLQGHFLQGHFLRHKFFFHDFCLLVCFQDEVKQFSSWKFFDWNRFGNRFGNDVSRLKK